MTRPWWDGSVLYEVYPRAFADSNGDGLGDLPGVSRHLDHLGSDGLGVDAIWLAPFYPHGGADGGYDVTDYRAVAPEYGRLEDVDGLIDAAHGSGMRVLVDLVLGHTSDRHPWFAAARASRIDPRRDWYLWADGRPGGGPPSNWVAEFGGSAWTRDQPSGQWYHHSFYPEQPDLNWRNPAVRSAIADVMRFWMDRGVDGFRLDAIQYLLKDPRLRNNPPATGPETLWGPLPGGLRQRWNRDRPGVAEILRELRAVADGREGTVLLAELYASAQRVAQALGGAPRDGAHLALDHQLAKSPWSAAAFRRAIAAAEMHLPPPLAPTWAFSNHDVSRHATRWGPARARLAALILLTLRGSVSLYQGEEIGMEDAAPAGPWSTNDRARRDPARSPFDWDGARRQARDPASLLSLYRRIIEVRRGSAALHHGNLRLVPGSGPGILAYERTAGKERLLVVANMGDRAARVPLPVGNATLVLGSHVEVGDSAAGRVTLEPDQGAVLRLA
jgi:alpha-glucosidase